MIDLAEQARSDDVRARATWHAGVGRCMSGVRGTARAAPVRRSAMSLARCEARPEITSDLPELGSGRGRPAATGTAARE